MNREVRQGMQEQGVDEEITYTLNTSAWGGTPTAPAVAAYDITGANKRSEWVDVTDDVLEGSPSVAGDVITLPALKDLSAGRLYRVEVQFVSGGNTFEPFFRVQAED